MKNHILISIIIIALFSSCTQLFCGKPQGEEKVFMDSLNSVYKDVFVGKPTPCFPGYYELHLKTELDSTTMMYLDRLLQSKGYVELLVYDVDGALVWGNNESM